MTGVTAGAGMGFVGAVIEGDSLVPAAFFLAGRRAALRAGRLAAFREDFFFPDDFFFEAFFLATRFFEDFLEDFFEDFLEDFLEDFFLAFFAPPFFFEPPFFLLAMVNILSMLDRFVCRAERSLRTAFPHYQLFDSHRTRLVSGFYAQHREIRSCQA